MEYCHFVNVDPETKQERMHHITPDFPYGADLCDLHIFPGNMFPWHWHRELEVFYMRRGSQTTGQVVQGFIFLHQTLFVGSRLLR